MAKVWVIGEDRYGRKLGRVYVGADEQPTDVNVALVAQGLAWHYKRYSDDDQLADAEIAARRDRRGLWVDPNPVAPWDWREQQRQRDAEFKTSSVTATDGKYRLNTSTGVRHNSGCEQFGKTKRGRPSSPTVAKSSTATTPWSG